MDFTTLDQVEAHFQPLIAAAGEDQARVMSLRLERADAREQIRDRLDLARTLTDARASALQEFPYARQDELRGSTAEEIRAAAQASHQHVQQILEQNRQRQDQQSQGQQTTDQQGRQLYGGGSGAGGAGEPPAPPPTALQAVLAEHEGLMATIRSGAPFDGRETHGKTMVAVMDALADRTVQKNIRLVDMGKATTPEAARQQRGGVQFE